MGAPAILAGLVMMPQLGYMSPKSTPPGTFGMNLGWGGPVSDIVGHLVYGAVMGMIYRRPVGYPVRRKARAHA